MNAPLLQSIESILPEAFALLERMVGINSFTAHAAGVNELGLLTASAFAPMKFAAESVPSVHPDYGQHLFLRRASPTGRRILLVTHLDTVFPAAEEEAHDFRWRPEPSERRIYGPGTVDIKGGTVMIWLVLRALARQFPDVIEAFDWLIAANASEEALSADFAQRTIERCPGGVEAVLVFEGGRVTGHEITLVTARKGKADARVTVRGRGAHAGSSHGDGRNAIVALAGNIMRAAAMSDPALAVTVNVGRMRGGTVVNRVPHEASAELELRAFDPAAFAAARDAIASLSGDSPDVPGALTAVEWIGETAPWPGDDHTQALFHRFADAARLLDATLVGEKRGGLSDANYLHVLGPTLDGLGPSGGNAHCSERSADGTKLPEYVETDSFALKAALNVTALAALARESSLHDRAPVRRPQSSSSTRSSR